MRYPKYFPVHEVEGRLQRSFQSLAGSKKFHALFIVDVNFIAQSIKGRIDNLGDVGETHRSQTRRLC